MKRLLLLAPAAACLALVLAMGSLACTQDREDGSPERITTLPDYEDVLGEDLMLALHQAKNFHHIADVYLQNGQSAKAVQAVRQILAIPFPPNAPESEDVLLDARARLAKLLVVQGSLDEAMRIVEEGLAAAKRRSFFVSNLYTVKGEVHEALAVTLDDSDKPAADKEREKAIEARMQSIEIDTELQKKLMRGN